MNPVINLVDPTAVVFGGSALACDLVLALLRECDMATAASLDTVERGRPVAVLVDPDPADWETARAADAPVVLVSISTLDDDQVVQAIVQGADAVFHGDADPKHLGRAIAVVAAGGTLVDPMQARALAQALRAQAAPPTVPLKLTNRERDILASIDRGETIKQTARTLGISRKTVENLQTRLFRKLNVRNRAQAIAQAHALGLFPGNEELDVTDDASIHALPHVTLA